MYDSLNQIGTPRDRSRTLIFVRGFQGLAKLKGVPSTSSATWFRKLRDYGYRGDIRHYSWSSSWRDILQTQEVADEAGDQLWEWLQDYDLNTVSLMGFSMGATVIQRVLWQARRASTKFRRVYFLGGAASSRARWGDLLQAVREGTWNFYSENDEFLRKLCCEPIGVWGFDYYHPKTREIDLTWYEDDEDGERAVTNHAEWGLNVGWCLERARLSPEKL